MTSRSGARGHGGGGGQTGDVGPRGEPGGGCVAASHALAAEAGRSVLRRGGSAADAAIAMNAVLCVVYPHMAGLGGDGFWLVWEPDSGRAVGINASGPAAAQATPEWYRSLGLDAVPERGALAALTVPGAVDGWRLAHERWGRLPWPDLLTEAIGLARSGVPVAPSLARYARRDAADLAAHPEAALLFAAACETGAPRLLVQPDLARTLERLARLGARQGFYEGETASEMGRALEAAGSPLRAADLVAYRAEWVEPLRGVYRGLELLELPPNTQGIAAIEILRLMQGFDVAGWGDGSPDYIHAVVEATKLAFADRDEWVTDPRFVEAPVGRAASASYADERRGLIREDRALVPEEVRPGIRFDSDGSRGAGASSTTSGSGSRSRLRCDGDTCYFCAVDAAGLAVSCIQSIFYAFGSMVVAGESGIVLQDRGTSFSLEPGRANVLEPGKRPLHTLIPAMLLRDGQPYLVFGSMGGEGQPQTQAALVTRVVDFGYSPRHAIDAPRWLYGRTWGEASRALSLESRIPDDTARELARRGHDVRVLGPWEEAMGHAQAILVRPGAALEGAADPRGDGAALNS